MMELGANIIELTCGTFCHEGPRSVLVRVPAQGFEDSDAVRAWIEARGWERFVNESGDVHWACPACVPRGE